MQIPDSVWSKFEDFVAKHGSEQYCTVVFSTPDKDQKLHLYTCIINAELKAPTVLMEAGGQHTYFDWDSHKHGEIYKSSYYARELESLSL